MSVNKGAAGKRPASSPVLMLRTADDRRFFTEEGNFPLLIEFSKAVGAEVSVVKTQEPVEVLPLPTLARVFCDPTYVVGEVDFEVVSQKLAGGRPDGPKPARPGDIRSYITGEMTAGREVSLADLYDRYGSRLSNSAIRNHLTVVRRRLTSQGFSVVRAGVGRYRITPANPVL